MDDQLLLATLQRLEGKVDKLDGDLVQMRIDLAIKIGERRIIVIVAGLLGTIGGAGAGWLLHKIGVGP
jgi:hypothetical protein